MLMSRLALALLAALIALPARAADKVIFATNWLAEAEHGGFYQALADGTYARYGLDVTIRQGGPSANNRLLLVTGRAQFYMGVNMITAFDAVKQNIPTVVVASLFQKDPVVLMSHPGVGLDKWEDLRKAKTYFIAKDNLSSTFQWLKQTSGFVEEKIKPYTFNPAPFIADKQSIQQGYATSEPFAIEKAAGFAPNTFLLADHGYDTYSTTIEARADTIEKNPDLVQRFVDASIIGWYNYMHGDNAAANALIKRENAEMTDAQLADSIAKMKSFGIVESGDTSTLGIGAMTDARMKSFFEKMVSAGLFEESLDWRKAYTLRFVNKRAEVASPPK